jgi:2,3-bisphosphoglycerate-dependent phosphoglycerate mutase
LSLLESSDAIFDEFYVIQGLLHEALAREEELARRIEGYKEEIIELQSSPHLTPGQASTASQAAVKSLTKLEDQRKLLNQLILETGGLPVEDENNSNGRKKSNSTTPLFHSTSRHHSHPQRTHTGAASPNDRTANRIHSKDYVAHRAELQNLDNPLLVIIRHGKTEHNKLGLFTGWEDAPLAEEGRKEARDAGKLLQRHGIQVILLYLRC